MQTITSILRREPQSADFCKAMQGVLENRQHLPELGRRGRQRVQQNFSFDAFADKLDGCTVEVYKKSVRRRAVGGGLLSRVAVAFHFALALGMLYWMTFGVTLP